MADKPIEIKIENQEVNKRLIELANDENNIVLYENYETYTYEVFDLNIIN